MRHGKSDVIMLQTKLKFFLKEPVRDVLAIFGITIFITLLAFLFGLDEKLAKALYDPENKLAWWIRAKSLLPGMIVSVAALGVLIAWPIRIKYPVLRRLALVWLATFIIGGGFVNQILVKEVVQRPRPRETVLLGGEVQPPQSFFQRASIKGKSFPSGHVVIGMMFATPFFVLRRRKPKMAKYFLAGGIVYATAISASRMVLGAHYLTDVLWGGAITLASAAIAAYYFKEERDFPNKITIPLLVLTIFLMSWFNKFEMNLAVQPKGQHITFKAPCSNMTHSYGNTFQINMNLKGYGAPLSMLQLDENKKSVITLRRYLGIYRGLDCNVHMVLAPESSACFVGKGKGSSWFSKPSHFTCVSNAAKK